MACGTLAEARDRAYASVDRIDWPGGFCRRDIGEKGIKHVLADGKSDPEMVLADVVAQVLGPTGPGRAPLFQNDATGGIPPERVAASC